MEWIIIALIAVEVIFELVHYVKEVRQEHQAEAIN
jgi:uncharacterized Rmd1/YagE family protein